jgi:hypothetical protein
VELVVQEVVGAPRPLRRRQEHKASVVREAGRQLQTLVRQAAKPMRAVGVVRPALVRSQVEQVFLVAAVGALAIQQPLEVTEVTAEVAPRQVATRRAQLAEPARFCRTAELVATVAAQPLALVERVGFLVVAVVAGGHSLVAAARVATAAS